MSTLVYMCSKQRFDLVSKDYYIDELRYQDRIDGTNNAAKLSELQVKQNEENVVISFPKEMNGLAVDGQAWFYCPADAKKDQKIALAIDADGRQFISKSKFVKAKYLLKLNWKAGSEQYYSEKKLEIE